MTRPFLLATLALALGVSALAGCSSPSREQPFTIWLIASAEGHHTASIRVYSDAGELEWEKAYSFTDHSDDHATPTPLADGYRTFNLTLDDKSIARRQEIGSFGGSLSISVMTFYPDKHHACYSWFMHHPVSGSASAQGQHFSPAEAPLFCGWMH